MAFDPMAGYLSLSVLGDLGGAFSSWQQQQRARDLYKKFMDPNAMAGYANTYAQNIYNTTSPQIARQAAGALGAGGVSQGAYGTALMEQALAQYMGQLQSQGAQMYHNNLMGAGKNVGGGYGSSGASMDALKTLLMINASRGGGGQQQQQQASGMAVSPQGQVSDMEAMFMPGVNPAQWAAPAQTDFNLYSGME